MSDIIRASMDSIRSFTDMETAIGNAITTPNGVTVIPVSKVTMGIATGGIDYGDKKTGASQNFGGGGGTGVSITPIAFLTVTPDARVDLISLTGNALPSAVDRVSDLFENTPKIIAKIKEALF